MMKRMIMFAAASSVLMAGIACAAIPNTSDYLHKTTPMISGTVFSVDDRQIVVDTDQGHRVEMVMDSRTMLPTDLAPGMLMRAEFLVMENGQYYVKRITPIRGDSNVRAAEAAWNQRGDAADPDQGGTAGMYGHRTVTGESVPIERSKTVEEPLAADQTVTNAAPVTESSTTGDEPGTLPQTAGNQPLIGLLGLLALSGAGLLMLKRRASCA